MTIELHQPAADSAQDRFVPAGFEALLEADGEGDSWTVFRVPFAVSRAFGAKGRVAVAGTINGVPFRSSLFPSGDGTHLMMVNQAMQREAGVAAGQTVSVTLARDDAPRTVAVPPDLQAGLAQAERAEAAFAALSPSRRKDLVDWIEQAKKAETRAARVERGVANVVAGRPARESGSP